MDNWYNGPNGMAVDTKKRYTFSTIQASFIVKMPFSKFRYLYVSSPNAQAIRVYKLSKQNAIEYHTVVNGIIDS